MKFALLGIDAEALCLVREIARSDSHQLRSFSSGDAPGQTPQAADFAEVQDLCPLAGPLPNWEALLGGRDCDAVIVAGPEGAPLRFEQLRRLVQEAVPVVVTHPPAITLLEAYELEMVRQESQGIIVPLLPWRWYGWSTWWAATVQIAREREGADPLVGRIGQITLERQLADRSRQAVLAQLARDIDYVRLLCDEVTAVATLGASPTGNGNRVDLSSLAVQMTGPSGILVRWSVQAPDRSPSTVITVIGDRGKNRLEIVNEPIASAQSLRYSPSGGPGPEPLVDRAIYPLNLPDLVSEQVRRAAENKNDLNPSVHPTWPDVIRSLELIEGVEQSLRKGRTISVGLEGRTETDAFKGTMASIGCALLMAGLAVVVVAAIGLKLAQQAGNQFIVDILRWWPAALVAVFALFLLLQFFRLIIPRQRRPDDRE